MNFAAQILSKTVEATKTILPYVAVFLNDTYAISVSYFLYLFFLVVELVATKYETFFCSIL